MEEETNETAIQPNITDETVKMGGGASNFRPWLFKKGQSGNPSGKPKGTVSLKVWARKYIQDMTDEEKLDFMEGLPKDIVWRMSEGQPHQSTDLDVKGGITIQFAKEFDKKTDAPTTPETK